MGEKPYSFMCFYHYYHSKARRTMGIGTLDTAFSIDGKLDQNLGGDDIAVGTVIQGDGKIISIGITESRVSNQQSTNFYLRRYNRDGSDDTPFNDNARNSTPALAAGEVRDISSIIQKDGYFYVVGTTRVNADSLPNIFIAKYRTDGSIETGFGGQSGVPAGFAFSGTVVDGKTSYSSVIQSDGKIVVVGSILFNSTQEQDILLVRFNVNGSLDTTFGSNGLATTNIGSGDTALAVKIQQVGAEERIVVTGSTGLTGSKDIVLLRYLATGALDVTFGTQGKTVTSLNTSDDLGNDLVILPGNKIFVVGQTTSSTSGINVALARYNSDGQLDTTFDGDGLKEFTTLGNDGATKVLLDASSKIIIAGYADGGASDIDALLMRLNLDGTLDNGFGVNGIIRTPIGATTSSDIALGLAIQGNRIVISGQTTPPPPSNPTGPTPGDSFVASYRTGASNDANGDGKPDIIWRNYSSGDNLIWSFNPSSWSTPTPTFDNVGVGQVSDTNWKIESSGDFDGDGDLDIVYRNYGSNAQVLGQTIIAFANGIQYSNARVTLNNTNFDVQDTNWKIEATGDFDGDGKDDLVWRNYGTGTDSGKNVVWLMDGAQIKINGFRDLAIVSDLAWKIEAASDFNGDGQCDVVWRNYGSNRAALGETLIWFLQGTTFSSQQSLGKLRDANWSIEAARDIDSDGFTDLLWRNRSTGVNVSWLMENSQFKRAQGFGVVPTSDWRIEASGDFDGNGTTDLFWRNYGSDPAVAGKNLIWFMNGTNLVASADISLSIPDGNWHVETASDFDRDGKADLVWRNYGSGDDTGKNLVWLMNANAIKESIDLASVEDTNWHIEGAGDINRDGRTDLVWRNYGSGASNGDSLAWTLTGPKGTQFSSVLSLGNIPDDNWVIEGVGDYNADGTTDIFYRNHGSNATLVGDIVVLLNNNGVFQNFTIGKVDNLAWEIESIGDLNNDGRADLIWRNYGSSPNENGKNITWLNTVSGIVATDIGGPRIINSTWDFS
jgi:uncharacterized delta-60 repeat protein